MRTPPLAGEGLDVRTNRANGLWQIALVPKLQFGAQKPLEEVTRTRQGGTFAI